MTLDDNAVPAFTGDFKRQFFDGEEQITIEMTLMSETWDDILQIAAENGWKQNEALIVLLTTGLAFLRSEKALTVADGAAGLREEELKKLLDRLNVIEAKYAAIKNFAFDIMRDHRILELRQVPIERLLVKHQELVRELKAENAALRSEVEKHRQSVISTESAAPSQEKRHLQGRNRWRRAFDVLRGREK